MSEKRAAAEVRCRWELHTTHRVGDTTLRNVHVCADCKSWTANEPLYRYSVCDAKDRRKGVTDRRSTRK